MRSSWLFVASMVLAGACAAAGLRLRLDSPTLYTGTVSYLSFSFEKENPGDGITANPPFAFRLPLPAGMTYHGEATTGTWSCAGTPIGAQTIECTYSGALTPALWQGAALTLPVDGAPGATPGPVTLAATLGSAQYPLPGSPACTASPSTTGCVTATAAIAASSLSIVNWYYPGQVVTWPEQPLEAGTQQAQFQVGFQDVGYGPTNGTVTLKVDLPPRTHFNQAGGSIPLSCAALAQGDHEVVTCTTPAMYASQYAFATIRVDVAPDIPVPGPAYFHAAIGNAVQPPPSSCAADPYQRGCGRLAWATRPPRAAALAFTGVQHSPAYFMLGQRNGPLVANLTNLGEGNASATTVMLRLPPGFRYARLVNSIPAFACTPGGDVATGQTVACSAAGLPASTSGFLSVAVDLDAGTETPGPVVVLGAIDQSSPAGSDTLLACASDPGHAYCFWHEIATFAPCALQYGADGVYCDGFDVPLPSAAAIASR